MPPPSSAGILVNGVPQGSVASSSGIKNRILNGDMRIDQQRAGAAVTVNAAAVFHSVDKFQGFGTAAAGTFTMQRQTATPPAGFSHYLRLTTATVDGAPAAGSNYRLQTFIEGLYLPDFRMGLASAVMFSVGFWVRTALSTATPFSGSIKNSAQNRSHPFTFIISAANTWEFKSIQIPGDIAGVWLTDTGIGLQLTIDLGSGATARGPAGVWAGANYSAATGGIGIINSPAATFDITGIQVEAGSASTAFEQIAFGEMVRLCQREFNKSFRVETAPAQNIGVNSGESSGPAGRGAAGFCYWMIFWPVIMRATPTVTFFNPGAANAEARDYVLGGDCAATVPNFQTERGCSVNCNSNAGTPVGAALLIHYTADARL